MVGLVGNSVWPSFMITLIDENTKVIANRHPDAGRGPDWQNQFTGGFLFGLDTGLRR